jgi:hypothetical protein
MQLALRHSVHPIAGCHGVFHTDTCFSGIPSLSNCKMGQLNVNDTNFTKFYPMRRKGEAADTLIASIQDIGIPSGLHIDNAKELTMGRMAEIIKELWITPSQAEPYSPWQVRAELSIREVKNAVRHAMMHSRAPKQLWDYCTIYQCEIRSLTAHPHYSLNGGTPYEIVTGRTPDISEYLDFGWYDDLWYFDQEADFPNDARKLGKWMGVAHCLGQVLCYYILNDQARVIVRSSMPTISKDEYNDPAIKAQICKLNQLIQECIGKVDLADIPQELQDEYDSYEPMELESCKVDIVVLGEEVYDNLISAEVMLPVDGILVPARVTGCKRDSDGCPMGNPNVNPILDARVYEVTFPDGHVSKYAANVITEKMYQQVDSKENTHMYFQEITDHRSDKTKPQNANSKTTKGWYMQAL